MDKNKHNADHDEPNIIPASPDNKYKKTIIFLFFYENLHKNVQR